MLLYPRGESGWHTNMPHSTAAALTAAGAVPDIHPDHADAIAAAASEHAHNTITAREFAVYFMQVCCSASKTYAACTTASAHVLLRVLHALYSLCCTACTVLHVLCCMPCTGLYYMY